MTKTEFIEALRKSLNGKVDDNELAVNISYYSSYIDNEVFCGRNEQEVVAELGDPRLIAKTIVETYRMKDDPIRRQFASEGQPYMEENDEKENKGLLGKELQKYIKLAVIILVLLAVLSLVFRVIFAVLPVILMVVVLLAIIRAIKK